MAAKKNGSVWHAEDEEAKINVTLPDGSTSAVQPSDPFAETLRRIARDAGLSKFNVYVDGKKLNSSEAPNNFAGLKEVELKKYDEGA